ncbi:MAG: hypothetical protein DRP09_21325 [Candidatus Thorarchaeota archaeon]|nr:MAG: hypothetical protein DRP09_21325 [Candidatus Thorarchaeota archaeon]
MEIERIHELQRNNRRLIEALEKICVTIRINPQDTGAIIDVLDGLPEMDRINTMIDRELEKREKREKRAP